MMDSGVVAELKLQKRTIEAYKKLVAGLRTNNVNFIKVAAHDIDELEKGLANSDEGRREITVLKEVSDDLRRVVAKIEGVLGG